MTYGTPKTHQRRSVPVPRSLVDALAEHVAGRKPDDLVFKYGVDVPTLRVEGLMVAGGQD